MLIYTQTNITEKCQNLLQYVYFCMYEGNLHVPTFFAIKTALKITKLKIYFKKRNKSLFQQYQIQNYQNTSFFLQTGIRQNGFGKLGIGKMGFVKLVLMTFSLYLCPCVLEIIYWLMTFTLYLFSCVLEIIYWQMTFTLYLCPCVLEIIYWQMTFTLYLCSCVLEMTSLCVSLSVDLYLILTWLTRRYLSQCLSLEHWWNL